PQIGDVVMVSLKRIVGRMTIICFTLFCANPFLPRPLATAGARLTSSPTRLSPGLIYLAKGQQNIPALELGKPVERELAGGQAHCYKIRVAAGQGRGGVVEKKGMEGVVKVFGREGAQVGEGDSPNGTKGPEPVAVVAETAGDYRLEISSLEKDAKPGRYE